MNGTYWCNLNLRDKYFGYKDADDLVYVGELEVNDPEDAWEKFNRHDTAVPVLDEAEAPSMSVGDVLELDGSWYAVASLGFKEIETPGPEHLLRGRKAGEVIRLRY